MMIVAYNGHDERGPEERAMTFVLPFMAAMPVFVEAMGEPLGVAEKTMLWLEQGVHCNLGLGNFKLDSAVEAVGSIQHEDG